MPARTGDGYLSDLNSSTRDIRVHGERVTTGIGEHPAFRGVTRSYAALYDLQHDPLYEERLTYRSPTTGDPVRLLVPAAAHRGGAEEASGRHQAVVLTPASACSAGPGTT